MGSGMQADQPGIGDAYSSAVSDRERALLDRIVELETLVQSRDHLLAVAAHELRNPMHSLLLQVTATQQLAKRRRDEDIEARLAKIKRLVDRYVKRATVLLDVCRFNAHRFHLNIERCDLRKIVDETMEAYAAEAQFHRTSLFVEGATEVLGFWDRLALEQIVSNLVSNAVKYGAGAPVEVCVDTTPECAKLIVRDRGVGIGIEDQQRIFGQFEQAARGGDRRSGFGIGLWLVQRLVEAHGGSVNLESSPGQGSAFTIQLPLEARLNEPDQP